ncbi:esterase/lipase family protein [Bacillaceae bacterium W0354]
MLTKIKRIVVALVLIFTFSLFTQFNLANVHAGKVGNGNSETPGEWIIGDTPPNLKEDAPILLFVPGLNNVAQIFWDVDHSMHQAAYNAGYQTVFIQLHDAGGESADMWDNGQLLANKIQEISEHFNGKPITIVAYSKGGVDSQTALTYYGVDHLVDRVITLSSPHHGSELANLAYSSGASWLADLIGAKGDGTYVMQTGYMENFRTQTDQHPNAYVNDYYTLGGTDWGSWFSSTWFGGMYLSSYGQNDGVVTVKSSRLPGGQEIAVGDWNHTNIRTGITFPVFEPYLSSHSTYRLQNSVGRYDEQVSKDVNRFIKGGPIQKNKHVKIPINVEEKVSQKTYTILTASPLKKIALRDSNNKRHIPKYNTLKIDEGVLAGAYVQTFTLEKPESGEWELLIRSNEENAFLLMVDFESNSKLDVKQRKANQLSPLQSTKQLTYEIDNVSENIDLESVKATYFIVNTKNEKEEIVTAKGKSALNQTLTFDEGNTVYNVTIQLEGLTLEGKKFNRTIIDSIFVP